MKIRSFKFPTSSGMEVNAKLNQKPSPHLKKVLKSYQLTAANTLCGPPSVFPPKSSKPDNYADPNSSIHSKDVKYCCGSSSSASSGSMSDASSSSSTTSSPPPPPLVIIKEEPADFREFEKFDFGSSVPKKFLAKKRRDDEATAAALLAAWQHQSQKFLAPVLSAADRGGGSAEKRETALEGEPIACFTVGGEKRLCFPQILTSVLRPFSLAQINQMCDELQIFCSRCSGEQLEVLKVTGVIPQGAHSCGLITKTDAERLVNALLHRNPPKAAVALGSVAARGGLAASTGNKSFRVYHECFGKCKGIVLSHLYERIDSLCIECVECHGLFSPSRFVGHSHHRQEVRTCHWGFDSAKWRHYLLLAREEDSSRWEKILVDFKSKFDHKRKESVFEDSLGAGDNDNGLVIKRVRYEASVDTPTTHSPPHQHHQRPATATTSPPMTLDPAALYLPSKKRLPFIYQHQTQPQNEPTGGARCSEVDYVRKFVVSKLGAEGSEPVLNLVDKLMSKISNLDQICRNQESQLALFRRSAELQAGAELRAKVSSMESELHSLKKQLLRRE